MNSIRIQYSISMSVAYTFPSIPCVRQRTSPTTIFLLWRVVAVMGCWDPFEPIFEWAPFTFFTKCTKWIDYDEKWWQNDEDVDDIDRRSERMALHFSHSIVSHSTECIHSIIFHPHNNPAPISHLPTILLRMMQSPRASCRTNKPTGTSNSHTQKNRKWFSRTNHGISLHLRIYFDVFSLLSSCVCA